MNWIKHVDCLYVPPRLLWSVALGLGIVVNSALVYAENAPTPAGTAAVSATDGTATKARKAIKTGKKIKAGKTTATVDAKGERLFATVNGKPVTVKEYNEIYAATLRQQFYHGTIPDGQAEAVREEVTGSLIDRELLVYEAERRGIRPDTAKIEQVLASYDARYGTESDWQKQREQMLPELKAQVARHSMVEQLEKAVRDMPQPTTNEARVFYEQRPELFTEPEKLHLSVILLKVDPSSPIEIWNKAREEMQGIYTRIKGGADFAKEARLYSSHESAANGGDMGYLHGGMLVGGLQGKVDKLQVGEVSESIRMMEGYALYRIDGRIPAKLQDFSAVEKRVQELLKRDWADQAHIDMVMRLRASAEIKYFAPDIVSGKAKSLKK